MCLLGVNISVFSGSLGKFLRLSSYICSLSVSSLPSISCPSAGYALTLFCGIKAPLDAWLISPNDEVEQTAKALSSDNGGASGLTLRRYWCDPERFFFVFFFVLDLVLDLFLLLLLLLVFNVVIVITTFTL